MLIYNDKELRPGQRDAIKVIRDRVTQKLEYSAIILPTRYGKSDVIRLTAIDFKESGIVGGVLALSPNRYLRDQLVQEDKIISMRKRYDINKKLKIKVSRHSNPSVHKLNNNDHIISLTTQILSSRVDIFESWVKSVTYKTGLPVLIYVDECHTNTEDNNWGQNIKKLVEVGAIVVMLTATTSRADEEKIVGFSYEKEAEEFTEVTIGERINPKEVKIKLYEKASFRWKIIPHHETLFSDAWREDPLPICHLTKEAFDINVGPFLNGRAINKDKMLSEMSQAETRAVLGRTCEHPLVIAEGAKRLIAELKIWKKTTPDVAAIVFCSNDKSSEKEANRHANMIKNAILSCDPSYTIKIATSADKKDGRNVMSSFIIKGEGDILIVKQMAGVGVDCPRLKIALDLSSVRTPISYVQRIMRIATPYAPRLRAKLITPDDILGQAMWAYCVKNQGGELTTSELELIEEWIIEAEAKLPKNEYDYMPKGVRDSVFTDTFLLTGEPEMQIQVRRTKEKYPQICQVMTDPEIANMILDNRNVNEVGIIDETAICADYIKQLSVYAKDETLDILNDRKIPYGTQEGNKQYGHINRNVWKNWSLACGQQNIKPTDKNSMLLKQLLDHAIEVYNAKVIAKAC